MPRGERPHRSAAGPLLLVGAAAILLFAPAASQGRTLHGELDPSFGHGGRAFSRLGTSYAASEFTSMTRQPDGKLVLTGWIEDEAEIEREYVGVVERRNPDGALDTSFGEGGVVVVRKVPAGGGIDASALQGDGAILFGDSVEGCTPSATVHRLLPDGSRDPSFGGNGVGATLPLTADRIAVDGAGRILVAGTTYFMHCGKTFTASELTVARLLPDGSLDTSFGEGGIVKIGRDYQAGALAIREDGTVLVAGVTSGGGDLIALSADGGLDTSFGEGGFAHLASGPRALLIMAGDEAVVAGTASLSCCPQPSDFSLDRFHADGSPDTSFGEGGHTSLDVGVNDEATGLALAPDGSIVLAGGYTAKTSCAGGCEFTPILARFTAGGALDASFGKAGWTPVETPEIAPFENGPRIAALAVAPDGRILGAGGAGSASDAFVVGRLADGKPDPAFGAGGLVDESRLLPSSSEAAGVAIEPGGRILASAYSDIGVHNARAGLLAFRPNGRPDPRLGSGSGFSPTGAGSTIRVGSGRWVYVVHPAFGKERGYLARFDPLGQRDAGYGTGGAAQLPAGFLASGLQTRADGSVLVLGHVPRRGMAVFQLDPHGVREDGFGAHGLAFVGFKGKVKALAESAAVDSRGRIVLAGRAGSAGALARLLADGSIDRSFAHNGRFTVAPRFWVGRASVALQPGGRILLAISPETARVGDVTLRRLNQDGQPDRSFGQAGALHMRHGGTPLLSVFANSHQILAVMGHGAWGEGGVTLRAYRPNGAVDRRFGRRGVLTAATSRKHVFRVAAAARQPDGRLVVAGTSGKLEALGARVELLRFR